MEGVLTFFEATYIGVLHSGAANTRRSPQVEVQCWNQFDNLVNPQSGLNSMTSDDADARTELEEFFMDMICPIDSFLQDVARIFLEVMASDEAIREGSRAWSGGWLSHRLAAAQHLACELSDDVNTVFSIQAQELSRAEASVTEQSAPSTDGPVRAHHHRRPLCRAPCHCAPCPVPRARAEPLSLDSRALAPSALSGPHHLLLLHICYPSPHPLPIKHFNHRTRPCLSLSTGPTPAPVPISLLFLSHLRGRNSATMIVITYAMLLISHFGSEHYNAAAAENSKGQNQEGVAKVEELVVVRAAVTTAMAAAAPVHSFHHLDQDD
ncbi:hypothetical protein TYRP_001539 [Tyrophagus putrescentiae]|nr:hypothetical protein TYRP_001539 [Tyrophagus putrescentiae]